MDNVKRLPDSYAKHSESNNYKLLNLNEQAVADIKSDSRALYDVLDMSKAKGKTLDLYGDMVGQQRGAMTDEQYYYMILTRVAMNNVKGNGYSVAECVARIFGCEPNEIILIDGEVSCKVAARSFPLEVLVNAGFTSKNALEIINRVLPIGVSIDEANFDGTFEFAETADEYDTAAGFGNIEQTIGGYLGLILGEDENSPVLPL